MFTCVASEAFESDIELQKKKKMPTEREMQGETDQQYQAHIQEIVWTTTNYKINGQTECIWSCL